MFKHNWRLHNITLYNWTNTNIWILKIEVNRNHLITTCLCDTDFIRILLRETQLQLSYMRLFFYNGNYFNAANNRMRGGATQSHSNSIADRSVHLRLCKSHLVFVAAFVICIYPSFIWANLAQVIGLNQMNTHMLHWMCVWFISLCYYCCCRFILLVRHSHEKFFDLRKMMYSTHLHSIVF